MNLAKISARSLATYGSGNIDADGGISPAFAAGVLLIQSCMPSAVLTYLVGSMYSEKKVVDSVASVIVTSTVLSFITIPVVVFISLKYFQ